MIMGHINLKINTLYFLLSFKFYLIPPWDTIPSYMTSFQSSPVRTWNTVSRDITNVSKLASGVPSSKLNAPPNSCMPSRANIKINKKSRNNSDRMDRIELRSEMTRFLSDDQYLVTLNILNSRSALNTDNPALAFGLKHGNFYWEC